MKKTFMRIISLVVILSMCVPFAALADEYDLAQGDIVITGGESGQTVNQGDIHVDKPDPAPVVSSSATTSNTITVDGTGGSASVTIDNVSIDTGSSGDAGITTSGDATIIVEGDNTVKSEGTARKSTRLDTISSQVLLFYVGMMP